MAKKQIVIVGSGFAGLTTLKRISKSVKSNENIEVTLINDDNYFLFSPLLHEVATGGMEFQHITYPLRGIKWKSYLKFLRDEVKSIDLDKKQVITTSREINYDYLVLALGSVTDVSELPGASRNIFTLKSLSDALSIKNHIINNFEAADQEQDERKRRLLLTYVIAGGGYTGIQLATELHDFMFGYLIHKYKFIDKANIRIKIIEKEKYILDSLHHKFVDYIGRHLEKDGIELITSSRVTRIEEQLVEINDSQTIPTNTVFWVSGVVANPVIAVLNTEKDNIGRVIVNDYLELPQYPGVFALGDCAHYKEPGTSLPIRPRAHNSVRQAKLVACNVLAAARGREKKLYNYTNSAEMVSLGQGNAVLRIYNFRIYGLLARLIWIIAFSTLATGTQNKVRVFLDWVLTYIFGRDLTLVRSDSQKTQLAGNKRQV